MRAWSPDVTPSLNTFSHSAKSASGTAATTDNTNAITNSRGSYRRPMRHSRHMARIPGGSGTSASMGPAPVASEAPDAAAEAAEPPDPARGASEPPDAAPDAAPDASREPDGSPGAFGASDATRGTSSAERVIDDVLLFVVGRPTFGEALRLQVEHRPIAPAAVHQLFVAAELHDGAVLDHADAVGLSDGREPVRDQHRRAVARLTEDPGKDLRLAARVELRRGLV